VEEVASIAWQRRDVAFLVVFFHADGAVLHSLVNRRVETALYEAFCQSIGHVTPFLSSFGQC